MHKLFGCCVLIAVMCVSLPLYAQESEPGAELHKRLENLKVKVGDIYAQIAAFKKEMEQNPSPEAKQKMGVLLEEAKELENKIHEIEAHLHHTLGQEERPPHQQPDEADEEPPHRVRPDEDTPHRAAQMQREMHMKKQELHEVERALSSAPEEGREVLELQRDKVLQELEDLERDLHSLRSEGEHRHGKMGKKEKHGRRPHEAEEFERPELREKLERLRREAPEQFQKLMELRRQNPEKFRQHVQEMLRDRMEKEKDPILHELAQKQKALEEQVKKTVPSLRRAKGEERDKGAAELRNVLNELFEVRHKMREREMQKLEEKVNQMKQKLQKRKDHKDTIVDQHLKGLLGEGEEWGW